MIKQIPVADLKVGMYVHDLKCSWLNHPFARKRFLVDTKDTLQKIRQIGTKEVIIDTDRGDDVAEVAGARLRQESKAMSRPAANEAYPSVAGIVVDEAPSDEEIQRYFNIERTSLKKERSDAKKIQSEATQLIADLMADVKLGKQLEVDKVAPVVDDLVDSIFRNPDALMGLVRVRDFDQYTFEHSLSVTVLLLAFARHLELPPEMVREIGIGGIVHDIGKTQIPDHILNKPGKLTDEEFKIMRQHVVFSRDILLETPGISDVAMAVAAEHHEKHDGSGYPDGKAGDEIAYAGKMAAIVDVYDALTADRIYHKARTPQETMSRMVEAGGTHFDPELVRRFVHCVGIYPVGTLVGLQSGRLAVVMESGKKGLLYPVVRGFLVMKNREFITPVDIDLSDSKWKREKIVSSESQDEWNINPEMYMD